MYFRNIVCTHDALADKTVIAKRATYGVNRMIHAHPCTLT